MDCVTVCKVFLKNHSFTVSRKNNCKVLYFITLKMIKCNKC